jgi:hypothetical protein
MPLTVYHLLSLLIARQPGPGLEGLNGCFRLLTWIRVITLDALDFCFLCILCEKKQKDRKTFRSFLYNELMKIKW